MSKYLLPYENVSNPRTVAQQNFDRLESRAFYGRPTAGATQPGPPTTGTWELHEYYWDSVGVQWRCIQAGTPGVWTTSGGQFVYEQVNPSNIWIIDHYLGKRPTIIFEDETGAVFGGAVTYPSATQAVAVFNAEKRGKAYCQ